MDQPTRPAYHGSSPDTEERDPSRSNPSQGQQEEERHGRRPGAPLLRLHGTAALWLVLSGWHGWIIGEAAWEVEGGAVADDPSS
jgi:hypothetical protein